MSATLASSSKTSIVVAIQERKKAIMARLTADYLEQSNDPDWQAEVQL
jgi:hypothetical protein